MNHSDVQNCWINSNGSSKVKHLTVKPLLLIQNQALLHGLNNHGFGTHGSLPTPVRRRETHRPGRLDLRGYAWHGIMASWGRNNHPTALEVTAYLIPDDFSGPI